MSYKIDVEHDKEGFETYDEDRFRKDLPNIIKLIKTAIKNKHYPRIGELIVTHGEQYYITLIIYYSDSIRYDVSNEKQSVWDRMDKLKD